MPTILTTPTAPMAAPAVPPTPTVPVAAAAPPTIDVVRRAGDELLEAVSRIDLDDPRWVEAGPLVADAANQLRAALGAATVPGSPGAPPIVHQRDLATAARRLLVVDVRIVDDRAAAAFVRLAWSVPAVRP